MNLLAFGCAVTFIAVAGAYLVLVERSTAADESEPVLPRAEPLRVAAARPLGKPSTR